MAITCVYLLPAGDLHLPYIVLVDYFPDIIFPVNTLSVLYLLENRSTALCVNFCVLRFKVLIAVGMIIPYHSLKDSRVMSQCLSKLWNVFSIGSSMELSEDFESCSLMRLLLSDASGFTNSNATRIEAISRLNTSKLKT